ncbi:MAG: DUF2254 domain-containing protein [Pseudomonadota bacterium]
MLSVVKPKLLQGLQTLRRISRIMWLRVALITALSVFAALSAQPLDQIIPDGPKDRFTEDAVLPILTILANGMLAVATFSLGVMVSSHRTSAEQATPRIHRLLMADRSTQSMLATFIGAFVFSLCAIILFRAGYYTDDAAIIVFGVTIFVVIAVVVSLIRWIGQLTRIGSLEYALDRAEKAARETLHAAQETPYLGGVRRDVGDPIGGDFQTITAASSGFLSRVDMEELQSSAAASGGQIFLKVHVGERILEGDVLGWASQEVSSSDLSTCFVLEASRSVDQDPRYALIILREAASKALSPGVNDQGTAIEVIARIERLLWSFGSAPEKTPDAVYPDVFVPELPAGTLPISAFRMIARDGAQQAEVLLTLADTLGRLAVRDDVLDSKTAQILLRDVHDHGSQGLATERERERLLDMLRKAGFAEAS